MKVATEGKERLLWFDIARGVSIVLVVAHHVILWRNISSPEFSAFLYFDMLFRPIRMPLFFTISGCIASSAVRKDWKSFLSQHFVRFVYIYAIWGVGFWLFFHWTGLVQVQGIFGSELFQLLSMWYTPATTLWFVWALAIYYLIGKLIPSKLRMVALGITSVVSIVFLGKMFPKVDLFQANLFWYAPFFFYGLWFGTILKKYISHSTVNALIVSGLIFFVLGAVFWHIQAAFSGRGLIVGITRYFLYCAGVILGCHAAFHLSKLPIISQPFAYLGRNTLPIYLSNELIAASIFVFLAGLLAKLSLIWSFSPIIVTIIVVIVTILLKQLLSRLGLGWIYGLSPSTIDAVAGRQATKPTMRKRDIPEARGH